VPLPTDEKIIALSNAILQKFEALFGAHPGFRPVHAKGAMLNGSFTPSPDAAKLSKALHFNRPSSPATVRFSNSTGIPVIPDNDPNADPRGCAVRFHLAERVHTDIVAHSANGFPSRTGQDFLDFLTAISITDTWALTLRRLPSCRCPSRPLQASLANRILVWPRCGSSARKV
jgi:catalase